MKKFYFFGILSMMLLFLSFESNAQILRLGIGGGITSVQSPDFYKNSIANYGEGFTGSYHISAIGKLNLPLIPFTPAVYVDYHVFQGSGVQNGLSIESSLKIISIGAEGELTLLPLPLIKPYLAVDVAMNRFGNLEETANKGTRIVQNSGTRYGAGIGLGAEIGVIPSLPLDLSAKLQFLNLSGKSGGEQNVRVLTVTLLLLL